MVATVFPPLCAVCRAETGSGGLCAACWGELEFLSGPGCAACGRPAPGLDAAERDFRCDDCLRSQRRSWDQGRALFAYAGTGRRLVLALKHGDRLDSVPTLGAWLARAATPFAAETDLIVPVPIHWTRRVRRRMNQSAELARALARHLGRRDAFAPDLLSRVRRTPSQDGLDREGRALNVAGAFAAPRGARDRLRGAGVLLVDDVLTTGATLDAAAATLRAAGARHINVLVMALVLRDANAYFRASENDHPEDPER